MAGAILIAVPSRLRWATSLGCSTLAGYLLSSQHGAASFFSFFIVLEGFDFSRCRPLCLPSIYADKRASLG